MSPISRSLDYYAASLFSVTSQQSNRFSRALDKVRQVVGELNFPLAIAGGLAGIEHGTGVTTLNVDLVVPAGRADEFAEAAVNAGLVWISRSKAGWHRLEFSDPEGNVAIECLPAGERSPRDPADAPPIPEPSDLGVTSGLGYAALPGWALMKLVANRDKDRYHLGEAIKHFDESTIASVVQVLRAQPERYLQEFQRLLRTRHDEDPRNW